MKLFRSACCCLIMVATASDITLAQIADKDLPSVPIVFGNVGVKDGQFFVCDLYAQNESKTVEYNVMVRDEATGKDRAETRTREVQVPRMVAPPYPLSDDAIAFSTVAGEKVDIEIVRKLLRKESRNAVIKVDMNPLDAFYQKVVNPKLIVVHVNWEKGPTSEAIDEFRKKFSNVQPSANETSPSEFADDDPSRDLFKDVQPKLHIINGSRDPLEVFWLNPKGGRVSNGRVAPGDQTEISTYIGHQFAIAGRDVEQTVTCDTYVQGFRFDPSNKDGVPSFYTQRVDAGGFPIVASATVNPYALKEAKYIVDLMLANRPDVRKAMVKSGARLCIIAYNEFTTDLPEWTGLRNEVPREFRGIRGRDYWDARARGMGGSETDPFCSCAEENLLAYRGDPYPTENILIHEIAHNIHLRGMANIDPTFDRRLRETYKAAMAKGLWKGKYAGTNHHEYFAEGVQSWFDNNRAPDHDHNHVDTRQELWDYDPGLAKMCREVFGETELRYAKPQTRLRGHLVGYDPSKAPTFKWRPGLEETQKRIHEAALGRSR